MSLVESMFRQNVIKTIHCVKMVRLYEEKAAYFDGEGMSEAAETRRRLAFGYACVALLAFHELTVEVVARRQSKGSGNV